MSTIEQKRLKNARHICFHCGSKYGKARLKLIPYFVDMCDVCLRDQLVTDISNFQLEGELNHA